MASGKKRQEKSAAGRTRASGHRKPPAKKRIATRSRKNDPSAADADARRDRIIDVAIQLAEDGGFENVRQRDVARLSGVALGTLYKSFRSKEDILAAALHRETDQLERRLDRKPAKGADAPERLGALFATLTRSILKKPNYARALLKAMTSGEEVATKVVAHQVAITRMVIAAQRGCAPSSLVEQEPPSMDELNVAMFLQNLWFAGLVGWSAKLHGQQRVVDQVTEAATLILAGLEYQRSQAGKSQRKKKTSRRQR